MERRCWVNFQCQGVLLVWMIVGQGPIALAVGAGGGCLDIFSLHLSFLSPSLWETARYRLKYCLKEPLSPKQPTNQSFLKSLHFQILEGKFKYYGMNPDWAAHYELPLDQCSLQNNYFFLFFFVLRFI